MVGGLDEILVLGVPLLESIISVVAEDAVALVTLRSTELPGR
jgi:hypothetical protein